MSLYPYPWQRQCPQWAVSLSIWLRLRDASLHDLRAQRGPRVVDRHLRHGLLRGAPTDPQCAGPDALRFENGPLGLTTAQRVLAQ